MLNALLLWTRNSLPSAGWREPGLFFSRKTDLQPTCNPETKYIFYCEGFRCSLAHPNKDKMRAVGMLMVCAPALSLAFCPGMPMSGRSLADVPTCRVQPQQLRLSMDMWKRIGNVAKDKIGGAKGWVDSGAKADSDVNVRGAASGAVIGVCRVLPMLSDEHMHFCSHSP